MGNCRRFVKKKKACVEQIWKMFADINTIEFLFWCMRLPNVARCLVRKPQCEETKCCLISFLNLGKPRKTKRTSKNLLLKEETSYNPNKIKIQF